MPVSTPRNRAPRARLAAVIAAACTASSVSAQIPELVHYQGRMVDGTNLVSGEAQVVFRLHNADQSGQLLYAETQTVVAVDGLYSTHLGASNAVPGATPLSGSPTAGS